MRTRKGKWLIFFFFFIIPNLFIQNLFGVQPEKFLIGEDPDYTIFIEAMNAKWLIVCEFNSEHRYSFIYNRLTGEKNIIFDSNSDHLFHYNLNIDGDNAVYIVYDKRDYFHTLYLYGYNMEVKEKFLIDILSFTTCNPRIEKDIVVYRKGFDIKVYNIKTGKSETIYKSGRSDADKQYYVDGWSNPSISGNWVVWPEPKLAPPGTDRYSEEYLNKQHILAYNLYTKELFLVASNVVCSSPQISGKFVSWVEEIQDKGIYKGKYNIDGEYASKITAYNIETRTEFDVCTNRLTRHIDKEMIGFCGDTIIWSEHPYFEEEHNIINIYGCDLSNGNNKEFFIITLPDEREDECIDIGINKDDNLLYWAERFCPPPGSPGHTNGKVWGLKLNQWILPVKPSIKVERGAYNSFVFRIFPVFTNYQYQLFYSDRLTGPWYPIGEPSPIWADNVELKIVDVPPESEVKSRFYQVMVYYSN